MKINGKNIFTVFRAAAKEWIAIDPFRKSAVIAYYFIFAFPGLLVVIITLAGFFSGMMQSTAIWHHKSHL